MEKELNNFVSKEQSPCMLNVYNKNYETKKVDVFSDIQENNTGIIYISGDNGLNGTTTSIIRMQSNSLMKLMFNGFWLNGKKYMYIDWFSKFQFQSTIIDLPINISKDTDKFELEIPQESDCVFTFFPKNKEYPSIDKCDLQKGNQLYIIATNKTETLKEVNILDKNYFPNGFEDEDLKIEIAICDLNDDKQIETKSIGCFTFISEQLTGKIKLNDDKEIFTHLDLNQYQSCMIDFGCNETFKIGDKFSFNLLPYSKVMYSFNSLPSKHQFQKPLFIKTN